MNPFTNPAMFESMKKNMTPEMMRTATQQMNNMSDDDLRRMGQQSGMNFSPEMMRQASSMFNNMDSDQINNMMKMAGNMNPATAAAAAQSQQQQQKPQSSNTQNNQKPPKIAETATQNSQSVLFPEINKIKISGNERFKAGDLDKAASLYLEAIINAEEARMQKLSNAQEKELNELEISCRNNYCSLKAKQNDFHTVIIHSQAVLKIDPNNTKAKFRQGQGFYGLKKYEKALEFLSQAKNASPQDSIIADLHALCDAEVEKIQAEKANKESTQAAESKRAEQNTQPEKEIEEQKENKTDKKNRDDDVIIREEIPIKEEKSTASSAPQPSNLTSAGAGIDQNKIKQVQEQVSKMSDDELQRVANSVKCMDNATLKQMYKQQGIELTDLQIQQMKSMASPELMKQAVNNPNAPVMPVNNSNAPVNPANPLSPSPEVIKSTQEKMKNMNDTELKSMVDMMKTMDNSFLKNMYKQQGMDLSDEQINMMKTMMTPEMIKTATKMNPNNIPAAQFNSAAASSSANNNNDNSSSSQLQGSSSDSVSSQQEQPQTAAQQMPDMSSMAGMMENTAMIETAVNMIIANPEMLKMMAGQLGDNPVGRYLQNASPEDLRKLVNKLKYLVPVVKYGYKGFQLVKRFKGPIVILVVAAFVKYFFL